MIQRTRLAKRTAAASAVFLLAACSSGTEQTVPSSTSPGSVVVTSTTVDASAATTLSDWIDEQIAAGRTHASATEGRGTDAWIIEVEGAARLVLGDGSLVELPADLPPDGSPSLVGFGDRIALFEWDGPTPLLWLLEVPTGQWTKGPDLGIEGQPQSLLGAVPLGDSLLVLSEGGVDRGDGILVPNDQRGVLVSSTLELTPMATPPDGLFLGFSSTIGSHALVLGNDTGGGGLLPVIQPWDFDAATNTWTAVPIPTWMNCSDPCTWNTPHENGDRFLEAATGQGIVKRLPDDSIGLYEPNSRQWRQLDTPPFTPTTPVTALLDGDLLVVANEDPGPPSADRPFGTVGVLDVITGHWATTDLLEPAMLPTIIGGWEERDDGHVAVLGLVDQTRHLQPRFAYEAATREWRTATADDIALWNRLVPFEYAFDIRDLVVAPTPEFITRPYVDPAVCGSGAKAEYTTSPGSGWVPFAVGPSQMVPLQVFASETDGVAKPFAVVLRLASTANDRSNDHPVLINGVKVSISVLSNGNAEATWTLPDGTWADLRSRDLDEAAIVALITRLTSRGWSADIPGFDLAPSASPDGLVLLHEGLNTGVAGTTTHFECMTDPEGDVYSIDVLQGDPVYVYFGILDRPRPYAVGVNGGGAITITAPRTTELITLADITNADSATWDALPGGV